MNLWCQCLLAGAAAATAVIGTQEQLDKIQGQTVVLYTSGLSAACEVFEPVWNAAVEGAQRDGVELEFATVDCDATPTLCPGLKSLPVLKTWTMGSGREFRPSAHSSGVLLDYFKSLTGIKPKVQTEEGERDAELLYAPFFQEDGIPLPVYPREFTPVHGKGESVKLTVENFDSVVVNSGEPWMVKFYSPRCPYSRAMADEWEKYAQTGLFNIAEFDCLQDTNYCLSSGVQFYPTIMFVHGGYRREYVSTLETAQWEAFHQMQSGAQLVPTQHFDDLRTLVDAAASKGVPTFLFVHDDSATLEDWNALVGHSRVFEDAASALLRTSHAESRRWMGVNRLGTALVYAGKTEAEDGSEEKFWIQYPHGNAPLQMRDTQQISEWVNQVRFAGPIMLNVSQIPAINNYSDWHAVMIAHNTRYERFGALRRAAKAAYDAATQRQTESRAELRNLRHSLHQKYKKEGKTSVYRRIYQTPVDAPFLADISYSYIPKEEWDRQFGEYLDTEGHEEGDIIFLNFARGVYIDEADGAKVTSLSPVVTETGEERTMRRHPGVMPVVRPRAVFEPPLKFGDRAAIFGHRNWVIVAVVAAAAVALLARGGLAVRNKYRQPAKID